MTREEINTKIEAMRRIIDNPQTPDNIRATAQEKLDDLLKAQSPQDEPKEEEPEEVEVEETTEVEVEETTPTPKEEKAPKPKSNKKEDVVDAMLSTLRTMMLAMQGSGVDSAEVRKLIEEYLNKRKIALDELDKSVLDEIKKNQTVVITIPNYGLEITMDKNDTNIPNIFSIIDDVLAGNNVYLIGEAGGGKTYTAEKVAEILNRDFMVMNCSQYTSPVEILGGQTIEGYKDGKLVISWKDGKLLILDEMPKLDPNTAGLFNDALAKASKTRKNAYINSVNPSEPPIPRNDNFGVIATGNVYPNKPNPAGYVGNNQQDLSLLDRFSGSCYFVDFSDYIDQNSSRYDFLYNFLVGNYHEYVKDVRENKTPPQPRGLRTIIEANNMKNLALVSYRTIMAFRVAFEIELVRAIAESKGETVTERGKTVEKTFESYLVAFPEASRETLLRELDMSVTDVGDMARKVIRDIVKGLTEGNFDAYKNELTPLVRDTASDIFEESKDFLIAENYVEVE